MKNNEYPFYKKAAEQVTSKFLNYFISKYLKRKIDMSANDGSPDCLTLAQAGGIHCVIEDVSGDVFHIIPFSENRWSLVSYMGKYYAVTCITKKIDITSIVRKKDNSDFLKEIKKRHLKKNKK